MITPFKSLDIEIEKLSNKPSNYLKGMIEGYHKSFFGRRGLKYIIGVPNSIMAASYIINKREIEYQINLTKNKKF